MQVYMTLFVAALFFVLTPGIIVKLPPGGNKYIVAAVHALVFAIVYTLVYKTVKNFLYPEGFDDMTECPPGTKGKAPACVPM
jgi:hypothetical protein